MTENKRIVLNVVATYGRSLYALVIGLFCGRWALMALGEVDYGLLGVVGGLTAFIAFFNGIMSGAVGRFYALSVGAARKDADGLEECCRWFSTAVSVHTVLPLVLMSVGYPVGVFAIEHWLTIPADRVSDCVWVFRFVCLTCLLEMASVPFEAMYRAKQLIAELTVYSVITCTLNVVCLYYMITHPGVWLVKYALCLCVLAVVPSLIISVRAAISFPECRLRRAHLWNRDDIRELVSFAGWNLFGATGNLLKGAGMIVLVNKVLGPARNAAVTIANSVSGHSQALSASMLGAMTPAITSACGAGDRERMVALVYRTCRLGALMILPFAVPLILEIDEVMIVWLGNPPDQAGFLCVWLLLVLVLENLTTGLWVAISAQGRIAAYQLLVGTVFMLTLPLAYVLMKCGLGIRAVGYSLFTTLSVVVVIRVLFAERLVGISSRLWLTRVFLPVAGAGLAAAAVGAVPLFLLERSFARLCLTVGLTELALLPLAWFAVLDASERTFIVSKFKSLPGKESADERTTV